jgi:pyrimidine operon attenuation protein/uracil phosphoribosyltransferase
MSNESMTNNSMPEKNWRNDILEELKEQDVIAVESLGILTGKDIRSALDAVKKCEAERDEAEEQKHIKELQRQRAARMYGS